MLLKRIVTGCAAASLVAAALWPSIGSASYRAAPLQAAHVSAKHPRLPLRAGTRSPSAPIVSAPAPRMLGPLIRVINGLNKQGVVATDDTGFNTGSVPPDTTGSIGPNYYVETVNSIIAVYNRSDLTLKASTDFQTWLNSGSPLCDPQIQWDPSSQRWLFVVLDCNPGDDNFRFGWSKTSDPTNLSTLGTGGWCVFAASTPGVLSDYPKLGHSANYMIVGTNDFSDFGINPFRTAEIFWMAKPASGDTSCAAPTVNETGSAAGTLKNGDGKSLTATPVPVNTTTSAANGYIVSAYDPSGPPVSTIQSALAIWHVDASGTLHQDGDISPVNQYTVPNPAPNSGGSFPLDTLDGRLTQAVGDPATGIWTQHTVSPTLGLSVRSQVDWYEIQVSGGGVPSLTQQGAIASPTEYVFNGAISPTSDGHGTMIEYNRSSASLTPVLAAKTRVASTAKGIFDSGELVLGTSLAGETDFSCNNMGSGSCRWGDYAGASPDPLNIDAVWGSSQVLGSPVVGMPALPVWVTRNFAILVESRAVLQTAGATPPSRGPVAQVSPAPPPPPPRP